MVFPHWGTRMFPPRVPSDPGTEVPALVNSPYSLLPLIVATDLLIFFVIKQSSSESTSFLSSVSHSTN